MEKGSDSGMVNPKLAEVLARETGISADSLYSSTTLESLGIDSLEFLSLMHAIRDAIKEIPESRFAYLNTVGDIERELA